MIKIWWYKIRISFIKYSNWVYVIYFLSINTPRHFCYQFSNEAVWHLLGPGHQNY